MKSTAAKAKLVGVVGTVSAIASIGGICKTW